MPITVFAKAEICAYGKEIRLARRKNRLSLAAVVARMNAKGWAYYPSKLFRLENKFKICLPGPEMLDLLECLECKFTVK